jgi:hypothetical protein
VPHPPAQRWCWHRPSLKPVLRPFFAVLVVLAVFLLVVLFLDQKGMKSSSHASPGQHPVAALHSAHPVSPVTGALSLKYVK